MQFSKIQFTIVFFVVFTSASIVVRNGASIPGDRLALVTPDMLLKPLLNSTPGSKKVERRENVLRGLLEINVATLETTAARVAVVANSVIRHVPMTIFVAVPGVEPSTYYTTWPLTSGIASFATGRTPTIYPTPTPLSGSQTFIIHASDTRIIWSGASWLLATSSCNSTEESKKTTSSGHSLTFTVASATSIYLSLSARNVEYDVTINGRTTTYIETTSLDDCKLSWSSGIITAASTLVTINVRGPATLSTGPSSWSFEFHNFLWVFWF
ncbi:hypothetical protein BDZ94DRAFT_1240800 [Collybia nuda]|uniref:Uncharacterized protein n=1 Tax=Collybia nuda TaxID=64659 RepID=A0A9P5XV78_9AGAR|nr:hypothetical protein BDZ94DRAFT_1240800 [Collybia nuda]